MRLLLVILNIVAWIAAVVMNFVAVTLPLNGVTPQQVSDMYPNLFVPANFTFMIWLVIYVLLLFFSIYQLYSLIRRKDMEKVIDSVSSWYILSAICNVGWLFAWHYGQVLLSVIIIVLLLVSLIFIYTRLHNKLYTFNMFQRFCVRLPFSVYLGWISVATIANISAYLVSIRWDRFGQSDTVWTILVLSVAAILAIISLIKYRDYGYSLVIVWALIGIIYKRQTAMLVNTPVIITAWVCVGLIGLGILVSLFRTVTSKKETASAASGSEKL